MSETPNPYLDSPWSEIHNRIDGCMSVPRSSHGSIIVTAVKGRRLAFESEAGLQLSCILLRLLKSLEGRTIKSVTYSHAQDKETNPDGSLGVLKVELEPVSS